VRDNEFSNGGWLGLQSNPNWARAASAPVMQVSGKNCHNQDAKKKQGEARQ
jgi:hypothetical protein